MNARVILNLAAYRAQATRMGHQATGDPKQVSKHGLIVHQALKPGRQRANRTALKKDQS